MKVLSLFDGISAAAEALKSINAAVEKYDAYEIDNYAIEISKKNHPAINHRGDVKNCTTKEGYDLLIGGSPCQNLSICGDRKGLKGDKSILFYEYIRVLEQTKPTYFLLENVASMKKEDRDIISSKLGVAPIMINSSLLTAQSRKRYYWTNIKGVKQPIQRNKVVRDILENEAYESVRMYDKPLRINKGNFSQSQRIYSIEGKSTTITSGGGGGGAKTGKYKTSKGVRSLSPLECERLQALPDDYTKGISNAQRYKCIGNSFTVSVIAHILSQIFKQEGLLERQRV